MSVQVEKLEHNMAKLTITVPAETFNKAITQAYKKMKNQISIPGFRKGKVPQAMVEKMYGAGMFYEDAANIVIPEEYDKALAEVKDIKITSQPAIDVTQMEKAKISSLQQKLLLNQKLHLASTRVSKYLRIRLK